jgi:hypothetical protein
MPAIKDPAREAARVAAVRAALYRDKRWLKGACFGNVSAAGRRSIGQNARKTGADSIAFKLALRYIEGVLSIEGIGPF